MSGYCIVAVCPDCSGIKGIETELHNQETIDRWFARGDILSKRTVEWAKARDLCRCRERAEAA